jgi:uncharacterized protein (TIGR02588 family)
MTLPKKNWLEWVVFTASFVLVTSMLAYLVYDGLTLGDTPPTLEITSGEPELLADQYHVPISVTNRGDLTAEGVNVEVVLENGGAESERAEFEIAFLPRGATQEGQAAFRTDPRSGGQLKARITGYEQP